MDQSWGQTEILQATPCPQISLHHTGCCDTISAIIETDLFFTVSVEMGKQNQIQLFSHTEPCLHEQVPEKQMKSSGPSYLTMMAASQQPSAPHRREQYSHRAIQTDPWAGSQGALPSLQPGWWWLFSH